MKNIDTICENEVLRMFSNITQVFEKFLKTRRFMRKHARVRAHTHTHTHTDTYKRT